MSTKLNLRPPGELGPVDVKSILGKREDIELDFKGLAYSKSGADWIMSLLVDVASFANANGGYIFVGVLEKNRIAKDFVNIPDAYSEAQRMYDECNRYIVEKLVEDELIITPYDIEGKTIIIARINAYQNRPYMITYNDATLFYKRYDNGQQGFNQVMSINEIRDAFLGDRILREISKIEKEIKYLTNKLTPKELQKLIKKVQDE